MTRLAMFACWMSAVATGGLLLAGGPGRELKPVPAAPVPGMAEVDRVNLERNLRWQLQRLRARPAARPRVGVLADAGVWHVGAKAIVDALEEAGVPCLVLDRTLLSAEGLAGLEALILPGGWAPYQWAAAGPEGLKAIEAFVERGGRCLGICAGAYLLSRVVEYDQQRFPYPLGLFDGTARGPVAGLAPFPRPGEATLKVTTAGKARGCKRCWKSRFTTAADRASWTEPGSKRWLIMPMARRRSWPGRWVRGR